MKPRFSILTLLGVITYLAVSIVGLLRPDSPGNSLVVYFWIAAVSFFGIKSIADNADNKTFAQGMLLGIMTYAVASTSQSMLFVGWQRSWDFLFMPHGWITIYFVGDELRGSNQFWARVAAVHRVAMMDVSLIFGYAVGLLAEWYCRRKERKAKP